MKIPKLQKDFFFNFFQKLPKRDEILLWILCFIFSASLICAFEEDLFKAISFVFHFLEKIK